MADTTGRLAGKAAIITGGASRAGLGFATAQLFAREGAAVFLTDISPDVHKRAGDFPAGARIETKEHDVASEDDWIETFKAARSAFGAVDILVNNAGITRDTTFHRMTPQQWGEVINTNLNSVFNMTRPVIEGMRERKWGRIGMRTRRSQAAATASGTPALSRPTIRMSLPR